MKYNIVIKFKRAIDLAGAFLGLILVLPVLMTCSLLILIFTGGPILFKQLRPGYKEKPFELYKFRTMREACGADGRELPDEARLTWLGKILRRTSLDELPEIFNILKGDMSLVGPRPLLMEYLNRYTPEERRRHDMPPGITGWAQIHGRNLLSWEEKFKYDVWYVDNWSLWLDLRILCITVWKVLKGEGISNKGHATMEKFMGYEK